MFFSYFNFKLLPAPNNDKLGNRMLELDRSARVNTRSSGNATYISLDAATSELFSSF